VDELIEYQPQVTKVLSEARFRFKSLVQFSTRLRISSLYYQRLNWERKVNYSLLRLQIHTRCYSHS